MIIDFLSNKNLKLTKVILVLVIVCATFGSWPIPAPKASADITTGLTHQWKFDEGTGTATADSAGTNNGTLTNGPTWVAGNISNAVNLDGANDYVAVGSQSLSAQFSVATWVYKTTAANAALVDFNNHIFYIEGGRFGYWNNGSAGSTDFSTVPTNTWQHIAYTYDGTTLRGYLNGSLSGSVASSISSGSDTITLGNGGSGFLAGRLDEFRIYSRALTASDVTELFNYTAGPPDTTPPSTPTNLSATAVSSSQINLSWTASTDNVSVTGYRIYRGGVEIATTATNSYSNTGLSASTNYSYTVQAYDGAGNNSSQSSSANATTSAAPPPPPPPPPPSSGCSGSALTWNCAAGATVAQIQTAVNNASDGATVTFAAGNYNWSTKINLSSNKGITLIATPGTANVTLSGNGGIDVFPTVNKPYRLSGFNFSGRLSATYFFYMYPSAGITVRDVQIDHNVFNNTVGSNGEMVIRFGDHSPDGGDVTGVVYNNTFTGPDPMVSVYQLGPDAATPWGTSKRGTGNNIFVENNTFTFTTKSTVGMGCIDGWQKAAMVFRYNTVTNCQLALHEQGHEGGFTNVELYGNTLSSTNGIWTDGGRLVFDQGGGERMYFNNVLFGSTGKSAFALEVTHYRSPLNSESGSGMAQCNGSQSFDGNWSPTTTYRGYPCWGQPGRKEAGAFGALPYGSLSPMYSWLNRWTDGTLANIIIGNAWGSSTYPPSLHVQANRDYYNAVSASANTSKTSPFNGTTGMGYGTLANRPDTCTASPNAAMETGGGVGYWATDQGEWNSLNPGPDGQLYRCISNNTWSASPDYIPYQYPHPLVGGAVTPPPPPPPSFDFSMSNGGARTVIQGSNVTNSITSTLTSGSASSVSFSASGLPSGVSASFSPTSCTPTCSSTLTLSATAVANVGSATITVTGTGGSLTRTTSFTLTVNSNGINTNPVGSFDEIRLSDGVIRGWSYDPDNTSASNQIHIYIDGAAGAGGTLLTGYATDILRTDVNSTFSITGNHGIEYTIPSQYRNGVSHSIYLYGIDGTNPATATLLSGSPKSFTLTVAPPPPPPPPPPAGCTVTATGVDRTSVNTAITNVAAGGTVCVPAGTSSWTSPIALPGNKDLTIQGATVVNCTGTPGSTGYSCTATNNTSLTCNNGCFGVNFAATHRITGFTMTGNGNGELISCSTGNQDVNKHFRIDHNRLVSTSGWQPIRCFGDANAVHPQGIWDHNRLENGIAIHTNGTDFLLDEANYQHQLWAQDPQLGGTSRIFVEDNYFVTSVHTTNFTDGNYAARVAIRFNTTTGSTITGFEFHSPQGLNRGYQSWEAYGNTLMNLDTTDGCFHGIASIRGGTGVFFNNTMSGTISGCNYDGLMDNVRSTWSSPVDGIGPCNGSSNWDQNSSGQQGGHCRDQIGVFKDNTQWNHSPAGTWNQELRPAYFWGNIRAGNPLVFTVDSFGLSDVHIVKNRDYYEFTSSFNGTAGMGVGTLAARPATCTTNVGYWATDQGNWNVSGSGGQGALYKCISTNNWSATPYYTPYTYPHPWVSGGVVTPPPPPPPSFDFSMSNGGARTVIQGSNITNSITSTLTSGSTSSVSFSASGLPSGVTASFSPTSCNPTCSTTLTLTATGSAAIGTTTVTITGTGGSVTRTTTFSLTVNSTATPLVGDINLDHIVNSVDYSILNSQWFTSNSQSDLNTDGIVNAIDYSMLNANWFRTW